MAVISKDTFDPLRAYVSVRLQQGVPIVDADWNELQDVRAFELRAFLKWFIGDGVPEGSDGFRVVAKDLPGDFLIDAGISGAPDGLANVGRCLVDGMDVIITRDVQYTEQALHTSRPKATDLAKAWGVPVAPAIPPPATPLEISTIYLDVWERLVTPSEDPGLILQALGTESCARRKREWVVRWRLGQEVPRAGDADHQAGHAYMKLATLSRRTGPGEDKIGVKSVQDARPKGLRLGALFDGAHKGHLAQLGIGMAPSGGVLDVDNALDITSANFRRSKAGEWWSHIHYGPTGDWYIRSSAAQGKVVLQDHGGSVGIGTNNPGAPLSFGNGVANTKIALWDGGNANAMYGLGIQGAQFRLHLDNANARFSFLDAPAGRELVTIRGGGNVGIGTDTPDARLQVSGGAIMPAVGNSAQAGICWPANPGGGGGDLAFIRYHAESGEATTLRIGNANDADDTVRLWQQGADRLIVGDGRVTIGAEPYRGIVPRSFNVGDEIKAFGPGAGLRLQDRSAQAEDAREWVIYAQDGWLNFWSGKRNVLARLHFDTGEFSATKKNFVIPHPQDPHNRQLVHSCLEGPESAVYYRGEGRLCDGVAVVELPGYFEALTRAEGRTVQLTPIWEGPGRAISMLAAAPVVEGRFTVHAADRQNPSQRFYWEVKGVRADVAPLEVERPTLR